MKIRPDFECYNGMIPAVFADAKEAYSSIRGEVVDAIVNESGFGGNKKAGDLGNVIDTVRTINADSTELRHAISDMRFTSLLVNHQDQITADIYHDYKHLKRYHSYAGIPTFPDP